MRIVILSSAPVPKLHHFLRRLASDLPEGVLAGVVYERPRKWPTLRTRLKRFWRLFLDLEYCHYICHRINARTWAIATKGLDCLLRCLHACPADPNGQPVTLNQLARDSATVGTEFLVTDDLHSEEALSFVRRLQPELGVVFGTRVLKPELYSIPARGSINIHKHKVPEYRGSRPPGLWELRDGKREASVTVHRVSEEVDSSSVLGERSFCIGPFDTLQSVGLKADLLGIDLLIDVLLAESQGLLTETPQNTGGALYKGYQPHQLFAIERGIRASRPPHRVPRDRPAFKLILKTLTYPLLFIRNLLRWRRKSFPIIILLHHLVTDRVHHLGMTTDQFARHVRYLKRHYRIVSLPEAMDILRSGECSVPTVVLTFDDGYAENFLGLRAVAEAENVPTAVFITTQKVTDGTAFQHDLNRGQTDFPPLSWDQVRYLERHNVTIGSHTRSHFDCGSSNRQRLTEEIVGSREDLAQGLGHDDIQFFAFPKGKQWNMSRVALDIAQRTFPIFLSGYGGANWGPVATPCELKRCVLPASLWEVELLLQSVLNFRQIRVPARALFKPVLPTTRR